MRLNNFIKNGNERIINSIKPIDKLNFPVLQKKDADYKPIGLWYGFGSSWIKWVRVEMPEWEGEYFYRLEVNNSKILQIKNKNGLLEFTKEYGVSNYFVDWFNVSKKYSGIEFNPYIKSQLNYAQFGLAWYGAIDVASGCIWKKDAIRKWEEII